jgi:drug/metabolite transporter (DMT)-like permease
MPDESPQRLPLPPTALALISHTLWGSYPVLAKLLMNGFSVPPLVLVATGQTVAVLTSAVLARRHLRWSLLLRPALLGVGLVATLRVITNILAINYTLAIYVQLINLLTPFGVALLGSLVFSELPPPHTFKAMFVASLGALLVIVGDPRQMSLRWGPTDGLGIGLALASVVMLALWTQLTRLNTHRHGLEPMTVFLIQASSVVAISGATSVAMGQDWSIWGRLPLRGWVLFAVIVGFIIVGGNILQITALSRLRAAFFASLSAWRLVVTLAGAALLLNEQLDSIWQVFGSVVVMVTVTLYLRQRVEGPYPVDVHASSATGAPQ